jgi:hypothetical protein
MMKHFLKEDQVSAKVRMLAVTQQRNSREALGGEFDTAPVLRDS